MPKLSQTLSTLLRSASAAVLLGLASCGWMRPSEEIWQKAHLNNVRIVAEDESMPKQMQQMLLRTVLDPTRQEAMIRSCVEKKTRAQVSCELGAQTFVDLVACGEKFKGKKRDQSDDVIVPKDLQEKGTPEDKVTQEKKI
ncbi:MAG: LipL41-expression chaperone Lep [Spirochaetia bacterium]|nr:LipL41-expression chaperone Lep [Spirochaetia bacterium]